jgi:hypothetical protein
MSYKQVSSNAAAAGSLENLPDDIRTMAGLRSPVVAWTALDPELEKNIGLQTCCDLFGAFLFLPCLWPYLALLWPCLCVAKTADGNAIRNKYWILTETELKVVTKGYDVCCVPGLRQTGNEVKTIPLENITDCGIVSRATCCSAQCSLISSLPQIYVDTARGGTLAKPHEAIGVALAGYEQFIQEILNRRDMVKGIPSPSTTAIATAAYPVMDRGDRSIAERIKDATALYESGILTKDEFDAKRREIVDSL